MRFLAGETLAARLERGGRMAPAEALPLLEQMADALDAAHRAGVIHRDFKPSNVMLILEAEGVCAVVTDFGLPRRFTTGAETTSTLSANLVGTLDYMAPELLTGSVATVASDVYALGMVAYKMVTGGLPFAADTPLARAILRYHQAIPSPGSSVPSLSGRWDHAILRALDRNPGRRFTRARYFIDALREDAASVTVKFPVMTRRRAVIAVLAAAALITGVLAWRERVAASYRLSPETQALYRKGVDDIAGGAYFAATKALEDAVKLTPKAAQVRARLAEAWVGLDVLEKASEEMLMARRLDNSWLSKAERLQIDAIDLEITRDFPAAVGSRCVFDAPSARRDYVFPRVFPRPIIVWLHGVRGSRIVSCKIDHILIPRHDEDTVASRPS